MRIVLIITVQSDQYPSVLCGSAVHFREATHGELDLVGETQTIEAVKIREIADRFRHRGAKGVAIRKGNCALSLARALGPRQSLGFGVFDRWTVFARAHENQPSPVLWNAELRRIERLW